VRLPVVVGWVWLLDLVGRVGGFRVSGFGGIPLVVVVRDPGDRVLVNHEAIHCRQMLETLVVGFYLVYAAHYLYLRTMYGHYAAYRRVCLEVEAGDHQDDLGYLGARRPFAWLR